MKAFVIAIAAFVIAAAVVVVVAKHHQNTKFVTPAVEQTSTVAIPAPVVLESAPEAPQAAGAPPPQTQVAPAIVAPASATAEEVAGTYRRVIEKIETAQPK